MSKAAILDIDDTLLIAGATVVFESIEELLERLDETPLRTS